MKRTFLTGSLIYFLAACALPAAIWYKPGVSQQQFDQDSAYCEQGARDNNTGAGPTTGSNIKASYEKCMRDNGYVKQGASASGFQKNEEPGLLSPAAPGASQVQP